MAQDTPQVTCRNCKKKVDKKKAVVDQDKKGYYYCCENCEKEFNTETETKEDQLEAKDEETKSETDLKVAALMEEIAKLKGIIGDQPPQQSERKITSKKIKLMSLLPNTLNLSTRPNGQGKVFTFRKYGQIIRVKMDELEDIISNYPKSLEEGHFYICDKDAIEELGLTEEYATLCDKQAIDEIMLLKNDTAVDLFLTLTESLKTSVGRDIGIRMATGGKYDLNKIEKIKSETGIDIAEYAEEYKEFLERRAAEPKQEEV